MQLLSLTMGVAPYFPKHFIEVLEEVEATYKKRILVVDLDFIPSDLASKDLVDLTKVCDLMILYRFRPGIEWTIYPDGRFNDYSGMHSFGGIRFVDTDAVEIMFNRRRIVGADSSFPYALCMSSDFGMQNVDTIGESYQVMHFAYKLAYVINNYSGFARTKQLKHEKLPSVIKRSKTIYIGSLKNNMAVEFDNKIRQAQSNISSHEKALIEQYRKLRELNDFVIPDFSFEDIQKRLNSVEDEFEITFPEAGMMVWTTKKLQFVHINKGKLPIGRIEFGITTQGVSHVASVECPSSIATPHSNGGGGICFGGFGATAIQALSNIEFSTAKVVLLEWIKSYNPASIYTHVETVMRGRGIALNITDWMAYAGKPADDIIDSSEETGDADPGTNTGETVEIDGLIMPTRLR